MLISDYIAGALTTALLEPWFIGVFVVALAATSMIRYSGNVTRERSGGRAARHGRRRGNEISVAKNAWVWRAPDRAIGHRGEHSLAVARPINNRHWQNAGGGEGAITNARQWQRLSDIIASAGERADSIDSDHRAAKIQLDVAEISLNRLLAEMSKVMPSPIERDLARGARRGREHPPPAQAQAQAQEPIAA